MAGLPLISPLRSQLPNLLPRDGVNDSDIVQTGPLCFTLRGSSKGVLRMFLPGISGTHTHTNTHPQLEGDPEADP